MMLILITFYIVGHFKAPEQQLTVGDIGVCVLHRYQIKDYRSQPECSRTDIDCAQHQDLQYRLMSWCPALEKYLQTIQNSSAR